MGGGLPDGGGGGAYPRVVKTVNGERGLSDGGAYLMVGLIWWWGLSDGGAYLMVGLIWGGGL